MSENETGFYKLQDNVQQAFLFRDQVKEALFYEVIPQDVGDKEAIAKLESIIQFALEAKQCLIDLVGKDLTNDEAITEIKRLQRLDVKSRSVPRYDLQETPEICGGDSDYSVKDREIERLKRCMSGIASFLDLPSDTKQPDICYSIMQLKQESLAKEEPISTVVEMNYLRSKVVVLEKVIARLVGE